MSGRMFDYQDGRVDVSFRHEKHDWLRMRVRAYGEAQTMTDLSDDFEPTRRRVLAIPKTQISCRISSVFCPFRDLLAWLEAIAAGVQECAFEWDAEGPSGRLALEHSYFRLDWHEGAKKSIRMRADRRQVVSAFYTAFRRFVESVEYDPLRYERLRIGEEIVLGIEKRFTEDEIIGQLLVLGSAEAEGALQRLRPHAWLGVEGLDPLADARSSYRAVIGALEAERQGIAPLRPLHRYPIPYIEAQWDRWDTPRRRARLKDIFNGHGLSCHGAPLRLLRSSIVEGWLGS
jgi:hypothetical protein